MRIEAAGPKTAEYIVVGEAPNYDDMREKQPFSGQGGKLLRASLEKSGIAPDKCYITYIVKEFSPSKPTPSTEDIKASLPEFTKELASLPNRKYLLAVGSTAKQAITGSQEGVMKVQGQILNPRKDLEVVLANTNIMSVMSPGYVLRNNSVAVNGLFASVIAGFVAQGRAPVEEVIQEWSLNDLDIDWSQPFKGALDIETTPVPWWHEKSKLISAAISFDSRRAYTFDLRDKASMSIFRKIVTHPNSSWIMHNGKFDRQVLLSRGIDVKLTFDTMTAQFLIDPDQRKGLQFLSGIYLGLPPYKDVNYKNIEDEDTSKILTMNGKDAIRTYRLYAEAFKPQLEGDVRTRRLFQALLMPAINALIELEITGIPIDVRRLADVTEAYQDRWDQEVEAFQYEARAKLNVQSSQQMTKYFYKTLGLPVVARTEKGTPSLNEAARKQLLHLHPQMERYHRIKVLSQRLGTFLRPWADLERNGRLHTSYKPSHVVTGRLSSEKPNIQQVPREAEFRQIFGGVEGKCIAELDYSQIELRLAAMLANETTMLEAYHRGDDLHTLTAEKILGDPAARQIGKTLNFGLLYGAYPTKLREIALNEYGVTLSQDEAERFHAQFFNSYPALRQWHRDVIATTRSQGFFDSSIGRRRYFPNAGKKNPQATHEERAAINHGVQSLASDLMLMSVTTLHNMGFEVVATIHDSVLLLVPEDDPLPVIEAAKAVMEQATPKKFKEKFGVDITVPLAVEYSYGTHWNE